MDRARQTLIAELRLALAGLPPGMRAEFLEKHCAADPSMLEEIVASTPVPNGPEESIETTVTVAAPTARRILRDRYRIVRPAGRGGMGTVYEAIDLRLKNIVAVKRMTAAGSEADQAFEREAGLLASLRHRALPVVIDYFTDEDGRFLVMQYIDGEDLSRLLDRRKGPCAFQDVLTWTLALLDVLGYLHSQDPPVVHRDIKPSNLRLTSRGELVLLDFGLAKGHAGPTADLASDERSIFGFTPRYSPPEQLSGSGTTPLSDLYAVAATLYHLGTGVAPPPAIDRAEARGAGLPDPLVDAHRINADVPAGFADILARALSLDPARRFASAAAMQQAVLGQGFSAAPPPKEAPVGDRRVDAAMPSRAEVGRQVDLVVQVRFADSPQLGLEDWPARRRPAAIEQGSEALRLAYPVDPRSGAYLPARLRLKIVAPDFAIEGESERLIEVPPDEYSRRVAFLASPTRPGYCRLNVEVYAPDTLYLGAIPMEAEAVAVAAPLSELRVANLVLLLLSDAPRSVSRTPVVADASEGLDEACTTQISLRPAQAVPKAKSRAVAYGVGSALVVVLFAALLWSLIPLRTGMSQQQVVSGRATEIPAAPTTRTLRVTKPTGGTVVGPGGLLCGVLGSICSVEVPAGAPVVLHGQAADNHAFEQFTGDCPATGEMVMTDAKTCGATFVSNVGGSPAVNRAAPVLTTPPARPTAADAVATAPQPPAAPIGQEQHAKEEIGRLVNDYCQALQTLTADKLQPLFSVSNAPSKENFERSFAQYRTLKCALAPEPPEFVMLDAREQQGEGKLKFKMTQDVQMRNGRPSRRIHTLVTMVVSRRSYQSPWLIDRVTHEPLPK